MAWKLLLTISILILLSIKNTFSYYILVDAHSEECFFERLTSGTKLLLTFEVIEGGFLDIDIKVKNKLFVFVLFIYLFYLDNWT
jgi:hypothetical protein